MAGVSITKPGWLMNRRYLIVYYCDSQKPCIISIDSLLQSTVWCLSKPRDDRRRPVESTPAFTVPFSEQHCCDALSSRQSTMSLGFSGRTGLREVEATSHDASVKHLASHGIL